MIFKLELSPQNLHYDVLYPLYSVYIHIQTVCKARGGKRLLFVITNTMLYLRCRVILAADMVELLHNKAACFLHERKA